MHALIQADWARACWHCFIIRTNSNGLREERSLIPSSVGEMLCYYVSFELSILREAQDDLELHGLCIQAHEAVWVKYQQTGMLGCPVPTG
ncbi:hypothetical protein [Archangium violaceum]|uniref:Uncharacterized protein n=1 Tax=Archangium violaceum Cb vi76 TaxID=1406225 RepID=A0A084SVZ9_9BACT|nr:hypothetical protein [Archangium violaceum]KFA92634.1 hypothetical protein Q664_14180 [Archangium violaceum Cb vi76]